MQAVNQLSRPSGKIRSDVDYKLKKKVQSTRQNFVRYRYTVALLAYMILAAVIVSMSYFDNGYLLKEAISVFTVIGLLMVLRLFGKEVDGPLSKSKS